MPLQRLAMSSDYSERPIHPLRPRSNRNPPRAILISSTRAPKSAREFPAFLNSPLLPPASTAHLRRPMVIGGSFQQRLTGYGPYNPGLNFKSKTRKFADFSADEEAMSVRGIPISLATKYSRHNVAPKNIYVNDLNFLLPPRLISQPVSQATTMPKPENNDPSSNLGHPATRNPEDDIQHSTALSTSFQLSQGSETNTNWRQAVVSSCVVGAALVAVATGYACATVFRGALNVGQFVYKNRENIQQTCITCTQAVQSSYNAAKRRMVSVPIPSLPVGMRRRYASTPSSRVSRRRLFRQSRIPAQSPAQPSLAINPAVSILAPEGMPGVEYSGLSNIGQFPDTQDAADPDAFILPQSSDALASDKPYMTGGLFHEPTPPPPSPSPAQDQHASENLSRTPTSGDMELTDQPCTSYEESVFSEDMEDEYELEDGEDAEVPTAELFGDEGHMALEQDLWSLPGQFEPAPHAGPMSVSPTTPPTIEAPAPVIEHASISPIPEPGSPVIEPGSPFPSPPGAFSPPPAPTPTPSPKAATRRAPTRAKSRKRTKAPRGPPPPPRRHKAFSPPKDIRRSNRIAKLKK